jgi:hypothetical protein
MVTWRPPNADDCVYGGDGGSPVTHYIIEWDTREDFGTPAMQAILYVSDVDSANLSYEIGGRNVYTGVISTILTPNTLYFTRVTAFNSKGAGLAGYAAAATTTGDQLPSAPTSVVVATGGVNSLNVSWRGHHREVPHSVQPGLRLRSLHQRRRTRGA